MRTYTVLKEIKRYYGKHGLYIDLSDIKSIIL